jgi:hypothetical protein
MVLDEYPPLSTVAVFLVCFYAVSPVSSHSNTKPHVADAAAHKNEYTFCTGIE